MSENEELSARLRFLVESLEGQPCFSTIVGEGDDYALVLDIGAKRRRSLRLANPRLSFLQRTFEGDCGLLVECPWRIEDEAQVIASCFDPRTPGGRGAAAVADLAERVVESVRTEPPGWDLTVRLSGGWTLRGFAIEPTARPRHEPEASAQSSPASSTCAPQGPAPRAGASNWAVWTPHGSLVVGPSSQLDADPPEGGGGGDVARWRLRLAARHGENDT